MASQTSNTAPLELGIIDLTRSDSMVYRTLLRYISTSVKCHESGSDEGQFSHNRILALKRRTPYWAQILLDWRLFR